MQWLVIAVVHCTPKKRSLIEDFVSVYIGLELSRFLLLCEKHGEGFETQMI